MIVRSIKKKLEHLKSNYTLFKKKKYFTFISGIVEPPNSNVVTNIIHNVVVIITCRVSLLNSKCNDSAYEIAPLNPKNIHKGE